MSCNNVAFVNNSPAVSIHSNQELFLNSASPGCSSKLLTGVPIWTVSVHPASVDESSLKNTTFSVCTIQQLLAYTGAFRRYPVRLFGCPGWNSPRSAAQGTCGEPPTITTYNVWYCRNKRWVYQSAANSVVLDSEQLFRLLCTWSVAAFVFVTLTGLSANGPHSGPQILDNYI